MSDAAPPAEIVLASSSSARAALLRGAGIPFTAMPARVDETTAKESFLADGLSAGDAAANLADLKARKISIQQPGAFTIGADQMLDCNDVWFDKPPDRDHLVAQLMSLRGKTHHLHSAVCIYQGGTRIWGTVETAALTMPEFEALRDQARDIKNHTLANLDHYLELYERNATEAGATVHWASTAAEARKIILDICKSADAKMVTKGKSMGKGRDRLRRARDHMKGGFGHWRDP